MVDLFRSGKVINLTTKPCFRFDSPTSPKIRSIFKRAYSLVPRDNGGQEKLFSEWVTWETLFGCDLEAMIECRKRVLIEREIEVAKIKRKSEFSENSQRHKKKHSNNDGSFRSGHHEELGLQNSSIDPNYIEKNLISISIDKVGESLDKLADVGSKSEERTPSQVELDKNLFTVFLSNLPFSTGENDICSFISQVNYCSV